MTSDFIAIILSLSYAHNVLKCVFIYCSNKEHNIIYTTYLRESYACEQADYPILVTEFDS